MSLLTWLTRTKTRSKAHSGTELIQEDARRVEAVSSRPTSSHTEREIDNDSLTAVEAESTDVNSTSVTGEKENKVPVSSIVSSIITLDSHIWPRDSDFMREGPGDSHFHILWETMDYDMKPPLVCISLSNTKGTNF